MCRSKGSASATKVKGGGVQQVRKQAKPQGADYVSQGEDETDTDEVMFTLHKLDVLDIPTEEPFVESLTVNYTDMQFEVDWMWGNCSKPICVQILMGKRGTRTTPM